MTKSRDIADSINRIDSSAADATAITIDANENVGVGTASPNTYGKFVAFSSGGHFSVDTNGQVNSTQSIDVATAGGRFTGSSSRGALGSIHIEQTTTGADGGYIGFRTSPSGSTTPSERLRIDSSGRLLVGKTTNAIGTAGHTLQADGFFSATRSAAYTAGFNRLSDDGQIVQFFKDGSSVGSIGSRGGGTSFITLKTTSGSGAGLTGSDNRILPMDESALADNNTDLGMSSYRFKDLYLSNGINLGGNSAEILEARTETGFVKLTASHSAGGSNSAGFIFRTRNGTAGTNEKMRLTKEGNLLVGTTSTSWTDTDGLRYFNGGSLISTVSGGPGAYFNRRTNDGNIVVFSKDGSTVGSIGSFGGNTIVIDGAASVYVSNNLRPNANDTHDLGSASLKWRDIFTQGAVNTSDQNEKQQIAELTATEIAAAKRISALFKTFKWNNAVEAKGDNARTHTGVIAQDVRDALVAEGLDAGDYAFWCSDTWWEHDVEVPAVVAIEAQDAVLDDDGNIVTEAVEAVEAQDAYTRTDIYDTADEAPEGATERTQQSVRYNELMAFVGAATEQRLADIETRLTTLENAD